MTRRDAPREPATLEAMVGGGSAAPNPCWGVPTEVFFPPISGGAVEYAKRICRGCPARRPCVQYALDSNAEGIWGGTSERDRHDAKQTRSRDPAGTALALADTAPPSSPKPNQPGPRRAGPVLPTQ